MGPQEAAATLTRAMAQTTNPHTLRNLAQGLSAEAARMGPQEAAATLTQAMAQMTDPNALPHLAEGLWAVAARMGPKEAARVSAEAAATLTQAMAQTTDPYDHEALTKSLSVLLSNVRGNERAVAVAAAVGCLRDGPSLPSVLLLLRPAVEPLPHRLSDQDLVELLKQPLCVGPARRAVLDQLEYRYQRKFADHWEFVRFARQKNLGLDFTSPPKR
jgi:hypothetical protein